MCGIVGQFHSSSASQVDSEVIDQMVAAIHHRGPDASGTLIGDGVGLGHARLSIIDLQEASNQPFVSTDGNYALVFNGEIYNYLELREELKAVGHSFRTESDTEVLLHAFIAWGPACVERFNGMWAFCIYDKNRDELFCSRDRFGIKPFCYAMVDGTFYFASEAKAILAAVPRLAVPDYEALSLLLRKGIGASTVRTCFAGIQRLMPAHNLIVQRNGSIQPTRYWNYPNDSNRQIGLRDAAVELRSRLDDAVKLRLRSDVPVGITLSAGIDSSAIAAMASQKTSESLQTFTSIYESSEIQEAEHASRFAKQIGFRHRSVQAHGDGFLDTLRTIVWHLESPHISSAIYPLWNIMSSASGDVKVMLEGQGADELLAGYAFTFYPHAVFDLLRRGRFLSALKELNAARQAAAADPMVSTHLFWGRLIRESIPFSHALFRRVRGDEQVYAGPLRDCEKPEPSMQGRGLGNRDGLNNVLTEFHQSTLVELLHYGDAISMAYSIESRLPFMDHTVVEYSASLPGRLKFADGIGKVVLREALNGILPDEILTRKKLGFYTPISSWFRDQPEETVYPVLRSEACKQRGVFDMDRMNAMIDQHVAGKADHSHLIFRWITTELWFQEFID